MGVFWAYSKQYPKKKKKKKKKKEEEFFFPYVPPNFFK